MNDKPALYTELAKYYDFLYSYRAYDKESEFLYKILRKHPQRKKGEKLSILDLACGTGNHIFNLKTLMPRSNFYGMDINKSMLDVARKKLKNVKLIQGDMRNLNLKLKFDAIFCLSSSIQYLQNYAEFSSFIKNISRHLTDNGLFIFDIAYSKERWKEGYVNISTYRGRDIQIAEIYKSRSKDNISYWEPIYIIKKNNKLDFFIDHHEIFLFEIKKIKGLMKKAGFGMRIYKDFTLSLYKENGAPIFVGIKTRR